MFCFSDKKVSDNRHFQLILTHWDSIKLSSAENHISCSDIIPNIFWDLQSKCNRLTQPEHKYFSSLIFMTHFNMTFFLDTVPWHAKGAKAWSIKLKPSPHGLDLWVAYPTTLQENWTAGKETLPQYLYLERFLGWLLAAPLSSPPFGNGGSSCGTDLYEKIWCRYTFALNEPSKCQKKLHWAPQIPHSLKMEFWPWTEFCAFVMRLHWLFKLAT